ncbi:hypothetical protein KAU11_11660 [Candidatus Babeliales bacterium]|nr:hypothetical protein [Candidatus Babeliales bacterium]
MMKVNLVVPLPPPRGAGEAWCLVYDRLAVVKRMLRAGYPILMIEEEIDRLLFMQHFVLDNIKGALSFEDKFYLSEQLEKIEDAIYDNK